MVNAIGSVCIRCGKTRVIVKTWKEVIKTSIGESLLVRSTSVCPDPECQKVVDQQLEEKRAKQEAIKLNQEKRMAFRNKKK